MELDTKLSKDKQRTMNLFFNHLDNIREGVSLEHHLQEFNDKMKCIIIPKPKVNSLNASVEDIEDV